MKLSKNCSIIIVLVLCLFSSVHGSTDEKIRHGEQTNIILKMLSNMEARLQQKLDSAARKVEEKEVELRYIIEQQFKEAESVTQELESLKNSLEFEESVLESVLKNYTLTENVLQTELFQLNDTVNDKLHQLDVELHLVDKIEGLVHRMENKYYFPGGSRDSPARHCIEVRDQGRSSGVYWIRQDGDAEAYRVYCDNALNEGGWILTLNLDTSDGNPMWWGNPFWTNRAVFGDLLSNSSFRGDHKSHAFNQYRGASEIMLVAHEDGKVAGWRSFMMSSAVPLVELMNGGDNVPVTSGVRDHYYDSNALPTVETLVRSSSALVFNQCKQRLGNACTGLTPHGSDGDRIGSPEGSEVKAGLGNWHHMGQCPESLSMHVGVQCDGEALRTVSEAQAGWGVCADGQGYFGEDSLVPGSNECGSCDSGYACYASSNRIALDYALYIR